MFPHTITVWNRADDGTYSRATVQGLWEDNRGTQLRRTGVSSDNGVIVVIPLQNVSDRISLQAGDFIGLGDINIIPRSSKELQTRELRDKVVLVSAVDHLDFGRLPHIEVTGK